MQDKKMSYYPLDEFYCNDNYPKLWKHIEKAVKNGRRFGYTWGEIGWALTQIVDIIMQIENLNEEEL